MISVLLKSVIIASAFAQENGHLFKTLQLTHKGQTLSNGEIQYLAGLTNTKYTNEVLDNILIPRVVGTTNHEKVFQYIKKELHKLDWNIEVDEFENDTPKFGVLKFRNIIATLNPNAERYLVLACHYDSKYFEKEVFVGATDSAVPCAMILNLVKVMNNNLNTIKNNLDVNLKLIFFDGEEAFVNWGPLDSIYGARHLANLYDNSRYVSRTTGEIVSDLDKIDVLVLLDLIGHKKTRFYSYFDDTQNWYIKLTEAEDKLDEFRLLKKSKNEKYFQKRGYRGYIEDDHTPFLKKNVRILHLISNPFPTEWHTPADNRDLIDMNTVENINKILRVFVADYLNVYLQNTMEENIPEKEL